MSMKETGVFETSNASKYLQQLCKHFAHKVEVEYDETSGRAELFSGPAIMSATPERLTVTITAEDEDGLEKARGAIDRHLEKFAFREDFKTMSWTAA
ncbi:hypothetical protein GCM10011415_32010 [Salipiger pallidus]|uniref:DUF2218 domain-containing protein n=2 Tax=Salipiger pallidus TaxID=1775170 RepID=A0A8J2ZM65_9RHOB|nr:DUF2218 domain-containing protein [Salipiger pallidus]GGG80249.1 hypothetical protein GCM10011415_32010 [Salipiger pallidus]